MSGQGELGFSIHKLEMFGSSIPMLGIFYTLKEGMHPDAVFEKVNAQTDEETVHELKRAGILECLINKLGAINETRKEIVLEKDGVNVTYNRMLDSKALLEARVGEHIDILVGVGKIKPVTGSGNVTHEVMGFVGGDYDVPIIVYLTEKTKVVNINRDSDAVKEIVPNCCAGLCGKKIVSTTMERVDDTEVEAVNIIADYFEYSCDFVKMINDKSKNKKKHRNNT